jgi:UDP-N-acetylmuramyl pentapeptide phosphotransferase/UDP-N-acetylglucosamine-1-phosphate transferase
VVTPLAQQLAWMTGAALAAGVLSWATLGYARRARLLDQPGQRRSHAVPTPRGGGLGIVLAMLGALLWLAASQQIGWRSGGAFALGLALVAGIGWLDDHRPLRASTRLLVHAIAALLFVATLRRDGDAIVPAFVVGTLQVFLLVGAINFWNFVDGIDGLIATQSATVALIAMLFLGLAAPGWSLAAAALAGACIGFLPLNFPRAKIFMGDVGSGGLGFACGALLLLAQADGAIDALGALLAMSVIGIDATLTLLSRIARGRRWYHPHREHLYQWLVRRGRSHAQVTALYLLWNFVVVLPVLALMRLLPEWSAALATGALAAATLAWFAGKRVLARRPA